MSDRLLIHVPTGIKYIWQPAFAERADFREIIDVEATEILPAAKGLTPPKKKNIGKLAVVSDVPAPGQVEDEELRRDASRALP